MGRIYGAAYSDMELNKNAYKILDKLIREKTDAIRLRLIQHLSENGDTRSAVEQFMEDYTNESDGVVDGVFGVVRDIINEAEFGGKPIFTIETGLGVREFIPETDEEAAVYPSQERIRRILSEYLNPILKRPVPVGWSSSVDWLKNTL